MKQLHQARTAGGSNGFTLIEMLVAIAIAAVGILTVFEIFPMGFAATRKSESRVRAMAVAVYHLTDFQHGLNDFHYGQAQSTDSQGKAYYPDYKSPYLSYVAVDENSGDGGSDSGGPSGSAPLATAQDWAQDTQEPTFYWRATESEVLDPLQKYRPMLISTYTRQFADLLRVTVYVRGPLADASQVSAYSRNGVVSGAESGTGAVEVRLTTYVANRRLGYTRITPAADPASAYPNNEGANPQTGATYCSGDYPTLDYAAQGGQNWVNVDPTFGNGLDGFTVFNSDPYTASAPPASPANSMLSSSELWDTGAIMPGTALTIVGGSWSNPGQNAKLVGGTTEPLSTAYPGTNFGTGNIYGLDNVIIFDSHGQNVETNKIIRIENDPQNGIYRLWLLYPLQHDHWAYNPDDYWSAHEGSGTPPDSPPPSEPGYGIVRSLVTLPKGGS